MNKTEFIEAYTWLYGVNKTEAKKAYKIYNEDKKAEIVKAFKNNAIKSFYED